MRIGGWWRIWVIFIAVWIAAHWTQAQVDRETFMKMPQIAACTDPSGPDPFGAAFRGKIDPQCANRLDGIAYAAALSDARRDWQRSLIAGPLATLAIGLAVGWVWRGFRPKATRAAL